MVEFVLRSPIRRVVLLAAAHGMTYTFAPRALAPYGLLALPNEVLPGWLTTLLFGAASIVHFAADIGIALSAAMHIVLTLAATRNRDASFLAMSLYFTVVHTPLHYMRLITDGNQAAVAGALAITALMAVIAAVPDWSALATRWLPMSVRLLAPSDDGREPLVHVTHFMQRLVVAHVLVESWQRTSLGKAWLPPIAPPWPPRLGLFR